MAIRHVVKEGESLDNIAFQHGFFPPTLWEHPDNSALRDLRRDMNILDAGDVVFIPDLRPREVSIATGARHTFRRRGVPAVLRLRLVEDGAPRAHVAFVLEVDGAKRRGQTSEEGHLEAWIPPDATKATLTIGSDPPMVLRVGHLVPISTLKGVQQRLNNLGYRAGPAGGEPSDATAAAVARFQTDYGLPVTGEVDPPTRDKLQSVHDRPGDLASGAPPP